jgi:plastocyanin
MISLLIIGDSGEGAEMKNVSAIVVLAVLVIAGAALYLYLSTQGVGQTATTPTTPTEPAETKTTPAQQTTQPQGRVIVLNPKGSGTNPSLTFEPQVVKVKINVNNTVVWVNDDNVIHAVVARDGSFNFPSISPGQSVSFTFTRPGKYDYYCSLHPWMTGTVVVEQ